jgi:adenylate cyclase
MSKTFTAADIPLRCFQGVSPSVLTTCSKDGIPNVTYLSQVFFIDAKHVALSHQFFNKTKKNTMENPYAAVQFNDPVTLETWQLRLRFDHEEREGPLFERMSRRIDAIASHTGMTGIFKLRSADVYEVTAVERIENILEPVLPGQEVDDPKLVFRGELVGLQLVSQRLARATDLEGLLATLLETLDEAFGFQHTMVLLLDETEQRLYAIASRGYGEGGIGAEVGVGDGLIGTVARERCVLRVSGVGAELRYGRAIRAGVQRASGTGGRALPPEIPLPGLVDAQAQLALPLVAGDRLIGVIAVESRSPVAFEAWHEQYLEIIANQVALAIENMIRKSREAEVREPLAEPKPISKDVGKVRRFKFFESDDCVFTDGEYLIRNLPGRILWKVLKEHAATGRTEFTNRELRLDPSLGLPAVRDNLESRLVLLRKRLEQKCPDVTLVPCGRGQFRLEAKCAIELENAP